MKELLLRLNKAAEVIKASVDYDAKFKVFSVWKAGRVVYSAHRARDIKKYLDAETPAVCPECGAKFHGEDGLCSVCEEVAAARDAAEIRQNDRD